MTEQELSRMDRRTSEMASRIQALEGRMAQLESRQAVSDAMSKQVREDLAQIKGSQSWILRTVVSGFIGAAVLFIVSGGIAIGQ